MTRLDRLHLSMIVPLVVLQVFIASDYWMALGRAPWSVHVHVVTVTAWYLLLISQPYLIAQGDVARHRTFGILGFAIAGGVGFSSISMLPNTVGYGRLVEANPGAIGQFYPEFFYAVAISESVLVAAFLFAVYKAIILRKSKQDHAAWLASTAFMMLFPAVGRGVQNFSIAINGFENENFFMEIIVTPAIVFTVMILGLTAAIGARHSMLRHPAFILAMLVNLVPLITWSFPGLIEPMSDGVKAVFSLRFEGTRF